MTAGPVGVGVAEDDVVVAEELLLMTVELEELFEKIVLLVTVERLVDELVVLVTEIVVVVDDETALSW